MKINKASISAGDAGESLVRQHHVQVVLCRGPLIVAPERQFLIGHITGRDESVADIRVDAIR